MKNICVYCGSSSGTQPAYLEAAKELATEIVASGAGLVYGGASIGIMGAVADGVLGAGGQVTGIIPKALEDLEIAHQSLSELVVVADMHERKFMMAERSDGFIAMPGGFGTLEELFEMLTWSQLGFHAKPVAVLSTGGYYDQLLGFLDHQLTQGFVKSAHRELVIADSSPASLLTKMSKFKPLRDTKI